CRCPRTKRLWRQDRAPRAVARKRSARSVRGVECAGGALRPATFKLASRLVRREAVEQSVAAGAAQVGLAAAAVRTTRRMRRIPRAGGHVVAQSLAVDMADHRGALRAAGPIAAGAVFARREGAAFRRR